MVTDAELASAPLDIATERVFLVTPSHDLEGSTSSLTDVEEKSHTVRGPQASTSGAPNYPTSSDSYELHEVCGQGSTSKVSDCIDARQTLFSQRPKSVLTTASFFSAGVQSYCEAYERTSCRQTD